MELPSSGVNQRRRLIASGYSDDELRALRRQKVAVTLRPGAYVAADDPDLEHERSRHALAVRAALAALATTAVVSHGSAALLHGLPLWPAVPKRVHVTRSRRSGARVGRYLHVHAARLPADEVVRLEGVEVTSAARTVVDVCRAAPFESGVVTADAALRSGRVTAAELLVALRRSTRRPGIGAAARAIAFADGRSESVGESRSRVAIARHRLSPPIPQFEVWSAAGVLIGRTDFGWPEFGVVGEFDGLVKYGRLLRPGDTAADAVVREKHREDAIRDTGLRVVRWTWSGLAHFAAVAARLPRTLTA